MAPPIDSVDLGGALVMRSATLADREPLARFNADVHGGAEPDEQAAIWTRDLLRGDHPTSPISNHVIIEDRATGQIVSSCLLISQTWSYDGVPFKVGRPELVGTRGEYRGRGLIRRQFERLHETSSARGQLMQALTGIPNFYRRVGYEPALAVAPSRSGSLDDLPEAPPADAAPIRFRPATSDDLPIIAQFTEQAAKRSLIAARRDLDLWRYELSRDPGSDYIHEFVIIEADDRRPIGLLAHLNRLTRGYLTTSVAEVAPDISWPTVSDQTLHFVRGRAEAIGQRDGGRARGIAFDLPPDHPLIRLTASRLQITSKPFTWDVRVPDLVAFLRQIRPVLEARLAASFLAGFSGQFEMSLYQTGARLAMDGGIIRSIERWLPDSVWRTDVAIPANAFLYLLLGSRSLAEVEAAFPDCRVRSDLGRCFLETLFPKTYSVIWPVG